MSKEREKMKFSEFNYERPNFNQYKEQMTLLIEALKNAKSAQEQLDVVKEINQLRNHIETMATIASIRHSIDTRDEFYDAEQTYWDEYSPLYEEVNSLFYEAVVSSAYRDALEEKLSAQFFTIIDYRFKGVFF